MDTGGIRDGRGYVTRDAEEVRLLIHLFHPTCVRNSYCALLFPHSVSKSVRRGNEQKHKVFTSHISRGESKKVVNMSIL